MTMSRMKEYIEKLAENRQTMLIFLPGKGYVHARIESIDDDMVTIDPEKDTKTIMHYTQVSVKQE
jgi:hypothetical protein